MSFWFFDSPYKRGSLANSRKTAKLVKNKARKKKAKAVYKRAKKNAQRKRRSLKRLWMF